MMPTRSPGASPRSCSSPATRALASSSARYVIAALSTRTATRPAWARVVSVRFLARFVTLLLSGGRPRRSSVCGIKPVPGRWYGGTTFVPGTLGEDGDPLDGLVLVAEPTFPGCLIRSRPIGMFRMTDEKGGDDKILCVPAGDPRQEHLRELHHLPEFDRLEIEHFFLIYKELEPGKSVEGASWAGRAAAEAEVEASRRRLRETQEPAPG